MATTTNFGWETPDDTDLVKDGALAMRTLGNSIDTSMADLKGGTTGQILSKNSNTDMDFVWITNDVGDITAVTAGTGISGGGTSGSVTITNSMATAIDAKGDLIVGTGSDTFSRLAVGTNNQVLVADSAEATGVKWATPSAGAMTLIQRTGTSGGASLILDNVFTTDYQSYIMVVESLKGSATDLVYFRFRLSSSDLSSGYYGNSFGYTAGGSLLNRGSNNANQLTVGKLSNDWSAGMFTISNVGETNTPVISGTFAAYGDPAQLCVGGYASTADIKGVKFYPASGTLTGEVAIYGVK